MEAGDEPAPIGGGRPFIVDHRFVFHVCTPRATRGRVPKRHVPQRPQAARVHRIVEHHARQVDVERGPVAVWAVLRAGEKGLEGVVVPDTDGPATAVAQQVFHLGRPLGVVFPAEAEAIAEQPRPVVADGVTLGAHALPLGSVPGRLLGIEEMIEVKVSPVPRCQGLVLVVVGLAAGLPLVEFGLGGEQPFERRTGQLPGKPEMIGPHLRFHGPGPGRCRCRCNHQNQHESLHSHLPRLSRLRWFR